MSNLARTARAAVAFLALAFSAPFALAQSQADIDATINSGLPDNQRGAITANGLRNVLKSLNGARSQPNGIADLDAAGKLKPTQFPATGDATTLTTKATGSSADRTLAQRAGDAVNVKDFGALGDNSGALLSTRYTTLAQAQAVCPTATDLTHTIDWCAIQGAVGSTRPVFLPDGIYVVNKTIRQNNNGGLIFGNAKGSTQIKRRGDYGATFEFGVSPTALYRGGLARLSIYDTDVAGQAMTQALSPFHVVADNTRYLEFRDLEIANNVIASAGGGIKLAGSIDYQIKDVFMAFQNGAATGKIGLLLTFSTQTGAIAPEGGGKPDINGLNIEGGILTFSGSTPTGITSFLQYGVMVQSGDGLWVDNLHIQGARDADLIFNVPTGHAVSNVHMANVMLDITNGEGLTFTGTGIIRRLDFSGRISSSSIGGTAKSGLLAVADINDAAFDIGVEGFKGDCVTWNSATSADIVFRPRVVKDCNKGNGGFGAFNILAGNRITLDGGRLGGDTSTSFMVQVGTNVNGFTANGVSAQDGCTAGVCPPGSYGYIFASGANNISVTGGSVRGTTFPVTNNTVNTAFVRLRNVLGIPTANEINTPAGQ